MEKFIIPAILFLLLFFFFLFFIIREKKKYSRLKNLQDEDLRKRFETEYQKEILEKKEGIRSLEREKAKIQSEIEEKQSFNNSLFKLREEELNRLIAEKKAEKEKALEELLRAEDAKKRNEYNQTFLSWTQELEIQKNGYLNDFLALQEAYKQELAEIKGELDEFQAKREAINDAILREREIEEAENFYRIDVPIEDQEDIEVLNTIAPRLRNKEALNKLIYSVFIQRPMDEMIKRVTGGREISGIYKITYLKTGEAYIGKTTNIKKRWGEHIKSALDIGTIAHSSFHTRLKKDGIWNYTFEILEEVPKDNLTEREKFYIQLYGTDTQLNMKVG